MDGLFDWILAAMCVCVCVRARARTHIHTYILYDYLNLYNVRIIGEVHCWLLYPYSTLLITVPLQYAVDYCTLTVRCWLLYPYSTLLITVPLHAT